MLDYNNINLIPRKGIVNSRAECDTTVTFGQHNFNIPVIPANMESIINENLAIKLASEGYFYVMHRFDIDSYEFTKMMHSKGLIASISIGVNEDSYALINRMNQDGIIPDYITIDIAHGHSIKMESMLKYIKQEICMDTFVIAGNISTINAAKDLAEWGADAIKAGIAPGAACETRKMTGFGSRGMQPIVINEIAQAGIGLPIIADGGIREPGHINIALAMGATMVMVGGMLSGFNDSPGDIIDENGKQYKKYWGSASNNQSGKTNRIEGTTKIMPYKNKSILDELATIKECIQSGISYAGGKDLSCFLDVEIQQVSNIEN